MTDQRFLKRMNKEKHLTTGRTNEASTGRRWSEAEKKAATEQSPKPAAAFTLPPASSKKGGSAASNHSS